MGLAPYQRSYQRDHSGAEAPAAGYLPNPASRLTDQGADPDPADLAWEIRRRWRVIYYSARQAAGLPLWPGVDDFEILMTDVLFRLSSAFKPIPPIRTPKVARPEDDARKDRVFQPSCRVFRAPAFDKRKHLD